MQFIKGNLALRDHMKSGKRIFLFTEAPLRSNVIFETEVELREFDFFIDPKDLSAATHAAEYDAALDWNKPNETERKGLMTSRVGQGAYRKSILYRWEFRCAVTGYNKNDILIASHILPWNEVSNDQRLDVNNGILLSPNYDALFDRHLISFEDSGKIILSESLRRTNYKELGITGSERIKAFSKGNLAYLSLHRNRLQV